jgi:hypothetical protein
VALEVEGMGGCCDLIFTAASADKISDLRDILSSSCILVAERHYS